MAKRTPQKKVLQNGDSAQVARIIYEAYPAHDLLPLGPEKACQRMEALQKAAREVKDELFTFIVTEPKEAACEDGKFDPDEADQLIWKAKDELGRGAPCVGDEVPEPVGCATGRAGGM
jgi:hypothetical protein